MYKFVIQNRQRNGTTLLIFSVIGRVFLFYSRTKIKIMKLELKPLAPYLPYGLNYKGEYGGISTLRKLEYCRSYNKENDCFTDEFGVDGYLIQYIKPVLRPISDLTKEIEVNGEIFDMANWLMKYGHNSALYHLSKPYGYEKVTYEVMEKLFEWHFDVFGLIEKGLAIDINTLDKDSVLA